MTREEVTKRLKGLKNRCERLIVSSNRNPDEWRKDAEALDLALTALRPVTREQVAEVWKGCDLCLDDSWQRILMIPKRFDHTNMMSTELAQFCPGCGRPLTDKAVDMVMERLEALHESP